MPEGLQSGGRRRKRRAGPRGGPPKPGKERISEMKRRKSGGNWRREKWIMTASSILVLTAMTVTGVYIYNSNQGGEPENNVVDFSALEGETAEGGQVAQAENSSAQNLTSGQENSGELDYDPYYAEADRKLNEAAGAAGEEEEARQAQAGAEAGDLPDENVQEEGISVGYAEIDRGLRGEETQEGTDAQDAESAREDGGESAGETGDESDDESGGEAGEESGAQDAQADAEAVAGDGQALEAVADVAAEESSLHFSEDSVLEWPLAGNVLLNYSMDKTIYFPTLQQYKYNPSIVIAAAQGTSVACAADGVVKSIYEDPQTGTSLVMNLGNGYELTYGQLEDVLVEEGDLVEAGVFLGTVAAPTKYYTAEGTNVYFKMTKDGEPVNPLDYLG